MADTHKADWEPVLLTDRGANNRDMLRFLSTHASSRVVFVSRAIEVLRKALLSSLKPLFDSLFFMSY